MEKFCPFRFARYKDEQRCIGPTCSWYSEVCRRCAIAALPDVAVALVDTAARVNERQSKE